MKVCCVNEARANIRRGRDVATCDQCGRLILGYDNERDFQRAIEALVSAGTEHEHTRQGALWIIAKARKT
jgi:predicted type IV restriction endonuclease